ncbi:MAG: META domain-containing protein [Salegentibacter sp.]
MKKLIFILSLSLLFSCGSNEKKEEASDSENINQTSNTAQAEAISTTPAELKSESGNYKIIELAGKDVSADQMLLEFDGANQKMSGTTGCNDFMAAFKLDKDRVKFDPPVVTKMICDGKMENEETLQEILPKVTKAELKDGELKFLSDDNEVLLSLQKND